MTRMKKVDELLAQAEAALGPEPTAGEVMFYVQQRSLIAERSAVKAFIELLRALREEADR